MLIAGLLVIVSLSPVRGPGPRATRLEAMAETLGTRARMAVLTCDGHEDAALSARTLARANASGAVEAVLERARVWRLSRSYEDLALEACW